MIRSVTVGIPVGAKSPAELEEGAKALIATAREILGDANMVPRTIRYTLPAVGLEGENEGTVLSTLRWIDNLAAETDVRWFCLPFDFVEEGPRRQRLSTALDIITRFPRLFMNLIVADEYKMSVSAVNDVASLVTRIARKSNNGFDNFRVGASCGVPANSPFFPFSRHEGDEIAFSFALETTGIALSVVQELGVAPPINVFRDRLVERLSEALGEINQLGLQIAERTGTVYKGLDASFAPFPDGEMSVAALIEHLLGAPVGSHGSVFMTGVLTDAIRASLRASGALSVGFNGVMYSLMEDNALAAANSRRNINMDALVSLSAVCGCGVDMVPVSGNSFPEEIAGLTLDIAQMALSLHKPLGVRVLPIPNKSPNEFTEFNLDFLCDSRVVGLQAHDRSLATSTPSLGLLSPRFSDSLNS